MDFDLGLLSRLHGSYRPKLLQLYTGDGYLLVDAQGALERILAESENPPDQLEAAADELAFKLKLSERDGARELYAQLRETSDYRTCPHGHPLLVPMVRKLPAVVGKLLLCQPYHQVQPDENQILIQMEQGVSFGNGAHETTQMALTFIQQYLQQGDRVADIGCGTGILSIAAAKLGAKEVVAVDNDALCILETRDNLTLNQVHSGVTLFEGSSELLEGPFDLMIANMGNAPMILDVVPTALSQLRPGGTLIVGGIYAYQEFSLENRKQLVLDGLAALGLEFMESLQFKKCVALSLKYRS